MAVIIGILLFLGFAGFIAGGFLYGYNKYKTEEENINKIENEEKRFKNNHTGWGSTPATEDEQKAHNEKINDLKKELDKKSKNVLSPILYSLGVIFLGLFILIPFSIHRIDAGEVAVVKVWGEAKEVRTAGLHFDLWLSHKYEKYDAKVQQTTVETMAYSSDAQTMEVELVVQYQIQQENALDIAKNYGGLEILENRIETVAIEKTKSVLSAKSAMTIIETRAVVSPDVEASIIGAITADYYVDITTVVLTDIGFSDAFEQTVEDKMIAEQEKLKAEYEKDKAIIQAEQALEVTKLDAEAKLAEAKGEAQAIQELAKAQANSIKLKSVEVARMLGFTINETVLEDGVQYDIEFTGKTKEEIDVISDYLKYIEYLEVWNGELPNVITDSGTTIMIPTL